MDLQNLDIISMEDYRSSEGFDESFTGLFSKNSEAIKFYSEQLAKKHPEKAAKNLYKSIADNALNPDISDYCLYDKNIVISVCDEMENLDRFFLKTKECDLSESSINFIFDIALHFYEFMHIKAINKEINDPYGIQFAIDIVLEKLGIMLEYDFSFILIAENVAIDFINDKANTLLERRRVLIKKDSYGFCNKDKWEKEKIETIEKLISINSLETEHDELDLAICKSLARKIDNIIDNHEQNSSSTFEKQKLKKSSYDKGINYEKDCIDILLKRSWDIIETPTTGDKGVDIIAVKHGLKIAFQCKNWEQSIGTSAIQEVYSGRDFYSADYGVVIAESGFTKQAEEIAAKHNIILINKEELEDVEIIILRNK